MSEHARRLRKASTEAERILWKLLRHRQLSGHKFRRQHPVKPYIADFACFELMLIVEVDGGQHQDNPDDIKRTAYLEGKGWKVLRFWNNDILENTDGVLLSILERVRQA